MISRSFEQPDRTVSPASDTRNRYKIRYTRNQDWLTSLQVNAHDRVFGTHTQAALSLFCVEPAFTNGSDSTDPISHEEIAEVTAPSRAPP